MDTSAAPSYPGYRFPGEIISHCVGLYFRFCLSFRDVREMMLERRVVVSHEAIRLWSLKFGGEYTRRRLHRRSQCGDTWHIDEVFCKINGQLVYLWRAVGNWQPWNGCAGSTTTGCSNPSAISRRPKLGQTTTGHSPKAQLPQYSLKPNSLHETRSDSIICFSMLLELNQPAKMMSRLDSGLVRSTLPGSHEEEMIARSYSTFLLRHLSLLRVIVFLYLFLLSSCSQENNTAYAPTFGVARPAAKGTGYLFGVHPLHNPGRLLEVYGPLMDYLNAHLDGVSFNLEASRNYADYEKKLFAGRFQFALPNPYQLSPGYPCAIYRVLAATRFDIPALMPLVFFLQLPRFSDCTRMRRSMSGERQPSPQPPPADMLAFSIREFCRRHGISRAHFYNLSKSGDAPAVMRVGRRTLISAEAAAQWRRRMEKAAREASARTPEVKLGAYEPH